MSNSLSMLVILGSNSRGVEHALSVPFAHEIDIQIIIQNIDWLADFMDMENFAFVRGANFEIDRFVSKHEAIAFAKAELVKEIIL